MQDIQNIPNPDVNSPKENEDFGSHEGIAPDREVNDIDRPDSDPIPLPPDDLPKAPVEDPPGTDGPPMGDVDDSPKRLADN